MTAQAANGIVTTVNVKSVAGTSGNLGPQWQLQGCRYPWSNPNRPDIVSSLWIEQSDHPEQPSPGMYRVEVVMTAMVNKADGSMYDGSRYWMHKYKCLRLIEPVNKMDAVPDFNAAVDGYASTAPSSNGHQGGGTPGQPTGASRYTKDELIVRQVAAKGVFDQICAQIVMPEAFDELMEEYYLKIMGYAQDNEAPVAEPVTEEPAAPPAAPVGVMQDHFCEDHAVGYNKYSTGYMHKVAGMEAWCHEGIDGLYDEQGNPVTEALI
jgi:hypothetical protein